MKKENIAWEERLKEDSEVVHDLVYRLGVQKCVWYWNVNQHPSLQKVKG